MDRRTDVTTNPLTDVFLVMVIILMVSVLAVQLEARHEKKKAAETQEQSEIDPTKASPLLVIPVKGRHVLSCVNRINIASSVATSTQDQARPKLKVYPIPKRFSTMTAGSSGL